MRRVALIVLDGWGEGEENDFNAVLQAHTPNLRRLCQTNPFTTLGASGLDVGLPDGQMGNSEVGHLNLGAGRIVYQDLTRISLAIEEGRFFQNPVLVAMCERLQATGGALHLLGLVSDGGVHSHQSHLYALLELARRRGLKQAYVHAFLDGRDTPPQSGVGYLQDLESVIREKGIGQIATVSGRYYAMDRDTRWDRVEKAFRAICRGEGIAAASAAEAIRAAYAEGQTDEFVVPRVVRGPDGNPGPAMAGGDACVFFNFRADRARELTRVFTEDGFAAFDVTARPELVAFVTFTPYDETFDVPVAFPREGLADIFGEVISRSGLRQLRIAETEKYAHVTFFFNGGEEDPFPGEERILIPSPREVATYDQKPEMSAYQLKDRLVEEIRREVFDVIVVNFANLDMVGHTGVREAVVRAVEVVDACAGAVTDALFEHGYATVVTADHGNAEDMWDEASGQAHTAHTLSRVPFVLVDEERRGVQLRDTGILADVAPTLLDLMGFARPSQMTGRSLIEP
jgi:2,3-bisphosphoglycerate-independent phosphoglycerate mutase